MPDPLQQAIADAMLRVPFGPAVPPLPPTRVVPDTSTLIVPPSRRLAPQLPIRPEMWRLLAAENRNRATLPILPLPPRWTTPAGSRLPGLHYRPVIIPHPGDPGFSQGVPGQPPPGVPSGAVQIPDDPDMWELLKRQLGPQALMLHRWTTPLGQGWGGPQYRPPPLLGLPMPPARIPQPDFTPPGVGQPWVPTR